MISEEEEGLNLIALHKVLTMQLKRHYNNADILSLTLEVNPQRNLNIVLQNPKMTEDEYIEKLQQLVKDE